MKKLIFFLTIIFAFCAVQCARPRKAQAQDSPAADFISLFEQGRVLKSEKQFGQAAEYFKRALEAAPEGRKDEVRTELAAVLGWSGDFGGAIGLYEGLIRKNPGNIDARMGLASNLSWAGRYNEAIAEYNKILELKPGYVAAEAGIARILSWKGDLDGAIRTYKEILSKDPGNNDARLGLARTLFWQDRLDESLAALDGFTAPGKEALKLRRSIKEAKGPALRFRFSTVSDTDSNTLRVYRAGALLNAGPRHKLDLDLSIFEAERFEESAHAKTLSVKDTIRLDKGVYLIPRLSLTDTGSNGTGSTYLGGGISLDWRPHADTRIIASYVSAPLLDTARLIANNIRVREGTVALLHDVRDATFSIAGTLSHYSDGNSRRGVAAGASYRLIDEPASLIAGLTAEYGRFSETTQSGYFNPPHILSTAAYLTLAGGFYKEIFEYNLTGTLGVQSFNRQSEYVSSFKARLLGRITENLSVEAGYKWTRSALESAAGTRYDEYSAGINYLF
ncbi:MAG: tetratricopeptide repeat protein [Deltaproteobacteria bacterium]|nr:tetratricopeptide repeat protein [Deltaproteobacteria bacterium]